MRSGMIRVVQSVLSLPSRSVLALPRRTRTVFALVAAWCLASLVLYVHGAYHHGDVDLYHRYALAFWTGPHAFRSLPAEYPILSLLPFTLTLLPPVPDYLTVFGLWMLLLLLAGLVALALREGPRVAEVCAISLALAGFGTLVGRYDLLPAATTVAALWAARGRRFDLAYVLLAVGTLLKLYPALLVPLVAVEQYRALGRDPLRSPPPRQVVSGVGLCCAIVAAGFAAAFVLDSAAWLGPFTYNTRRPLQVESVPATLLWLSGLAGFPVSPNRGFHSYNLIGLLSEPIGLAAQAATVAGLLWVYWRRATGALDLGRAMVACLLVVIVTGRVLSPQYLIWVLPLLAIVDREYDPWWLLVCALTTLIFPFGYGLIVSPPGSTAPPSFPPLLLITIGVRNTLLVAATVRFLLRSRAGQEAEPCELSRSPLG